MTADTRTLQVIEGIDQVARAVVWLSRMGLVLLSVEVGRRPCPLITVEPPRKPLALRQLRATTIGQINTRGLRQVHWQGQLEGCRVEWLEDLR